MKINPFDIYTVEYENWFRTNNNIFESELLALQKVVPIDKEGLEIGVGSGVFAEKLNIKHGIDPAKNMLKLAKQRKIKTTYGFAEKLPYSDNSFDFTVFITSLCFINKPLVAFQEAYRVTKPAGNIIVAFIDKNSLLGKNILQTKDNDKFFKTAVMHSTEEVISMLEKTNFEITEIFQTLTNLQENRIETPEKNYGKGSFVVIKGVKLS